MPVPFATAPDMGGEWAFSSSDQRHRVVFNGIWEVGRGFQVSGLVYHGSGIRDAGIYGGDLRETGADFSMRLRPDGSIVPRNSFIQPTENRVDLRLQQRIPLGGRAAVDLMAEIVQRVQREQLHVDHRGGPQRLRPAESGAVPHDAVRLPRDVLNRLVAGSLQLVAFPFATGYRLPATGYRLPATGYRLRSGLRSRTRLEFVSPVRNQVQRIKHPGLFRRHS